MSNTMNIIAQALADNAVNYKNQRINAATIGSVVEARAWAMAVKKCRIPAYHIAEIRHNNVGIPADQIEKPDMSALYDAIRDVLRIIGKVNGAKLDPESAAEAIIGISSCYRPIDISPEMAHARSMKSDAKKVLNDAETDEEVEKAQADFDHWNDEVKRFESEPGNCKKIFDIVKEAAFVKDFEHIFGDAIAEQAAKPAEQVAAEEAAKAEAKKAKNKAKRQAKRQAEAKAKAEEKAVA